MTRNFIFDLDGTLVDSAEGICSCLREAAGKVLPGVLLANSRIPIGPTIAGMIRQCLPAISETEAASIELAYRDAYDAWGWKESALYPGVKETLAGLYETGASLFVCTNKPTRPALAMLSAHGIHDYFRRVICSDSIKDGAGKDEMLALLRREFFGDEPALVVGDTANDAWAAHACGIPFVWASYGYGAGIGSMAELDRFL